MKKMEASRQYDPQLLQPGDVSDPESYKVRKGKVGGYADYLASDDIEYATQAMAAARPAIWLPNPHRQSVTSRNVRHRRLRHVRRKN